MTQPEAAPKSLFEVIAKVGLEKFAKGTVVRYRQGVAEEWCLGAKAIVYPYAFFTSGQPEDKFMFFPVMELVIALEPTPMFIVEDDDYMARVKKYTHRILPMSSAIGWEMLDGV